MKTVRFASLALAMSLLGSSMAALAQTPPPAPTGDWKFFASWRLRAENWNWFPAATGNGSYSFGASVLRGGVMRQTKRDDVVFEFEQPTFLNLPTQASAPAPIGAMGMGALYFGATGSHTASLFLKQGYVRFKNVFASKDALRLGRFEYNDGLETTPADPTLQWVKQNRVAQRLIGAFGFTHVGRSLDAIEYTRNKSGRNVTALFGFPTRGVFDINGWDTLADVSLGYLSASETRGDKNRSEDRRLFLAYYGDNRTGIVKTDNRALAVRAADARSIQFLTLGGHSAWAIPSRAGKIDVLLWGAGQWGQWGAQKHGAYAYAAEAGFQPKGLAGKPWFRIGYNYYSGDGAGANGQHGTFIPLLNTPRIYARDPFFTEANIEDLFFQAVFRPAGRLTVRSDVHSLNLAEASDLWYIGGGAYNNSAFGYSGRPSGGSKSLGTLFDVSLDYQLRKSTVATLYFAYVNGGNVVRNIYTGRDSLYGYLEISHKF